MMEKPVAIVLGGTNPHVILVEKLKKRGYYVILIDYLQNPPARKVADEHIQGSTLDQNKVLKIAQQKKASLVISTCIDQANSVCCYVAEKLGLPHPYSYKTSLEVTDKGLMKKVMTDNGIPTAEYQTVTSIDEIDWGKIKYPSVVKPVDCNSSKGVRRVDSDEETVKYVKCALELSRTHNAIIERFIHGEEIQVDCISSSNGVNVMMTRKKQAVAAMGNDMILQSLGSIIPAPLSNALNRQVQAIAEQIASSFNLKNTPFFYQAVISDDKIYVLEIAPRIGGGLSCYVLNEFGGYDVVECAIDSFFGKSFIVEPICQESFFSTILIYVRAGVFDHVEGFEELQESGLIRDAFILKDAGTELDGGMHSSNRVAAFIVEGENYAQLNSRAREVIENIKVVNNKGEDMLNRNIYSFQQR